MKWSAHQVDGRIAANNAVKIRAALRNSIDAKKVFEEYQLTQPNVSDNQAQDRARARSWAMLHIKVDNSALVTALQRLWAEMWVAGDLSAAEAIQQAKEMKKADNIATIDWDTWKPGDLATSLLLQPPKAFKDLLDASGVMIQGLDKTGYERVGTALADSIRLGLSPSRAAKLINESIGDAARALTIAITESSRAMNAGAINRYKEAKLNQMEWMTVLSVAGGSSACDICAPNAGQVVEIGRAFNSGSYQPPAHPHCRCTLLPVIPDYTTGQNGVTDIAPKPEIAPVTDRGRKNYRALLRDTDYDADARYAAQRWQGEDYRRIQSGLSSGKLSDLSDEVREIVDILDDNMISLEDTDYLYRGMTSGLDTLKIGDKFKSPLYQAATTDPIVAGGFSKSSGSVLGGVRTGETSTILRIDVEGAKGMVIPDSSEFEVILARGTSFEVEDINEETINGVVFRIIDVFATKK